MLIITDRRYGSACSHFIERTSELKLAKIIGLGANLLGNDPHDHFDILTYAAGSVYNSDSAGRLSY